ncbi:hypothetical protein PC111_g15778 [Phytophthora cactorum]|nr:hypothetical protein PC111_g15778 [Phytophthora cactorum]
MGATKTSEVVTGRRDNALCFPGTAEASAGAGLRRVERLDDEGSEDSTELQYPEQGRQFCRSTARSKKAQSPSWTEGTAQISETGGQFSRNYATERRFQFFLQERVKDNAKTEDANTLREQWTDEPTKEQQEKYQGLHSYWDCQNSAHEERLLKLMKEWILDQTLPQSEIEARLHHFHFENQGEALTETTEETNKPKSYRDALGANMIKEATTEESTEAQRLYQLCVQQVEPTLQLRDALMMKTNHCS